MTKLPELPSGRQYTIADGADRVTVVEVGGGLRSYVAGGRELLDGFAEDEMATAARGQLLMPWPNRLGDGRYVWDGVTHQLALTEPGFGNAIHGLVCNASWECSGHSTSSVDLHHLLHPQPGYPFTLDLLVSYELGEHGLTVTTTAQNLGDHALPFAAGHHPYLSAGGGVVDTWTLEAPGSAELTVDERLLPTGRRAVDGTDHDFRRARPVGEVVLDTTFTDLVRDEEGRAWVRFTGPDGSGAAVWVDARHSHLQLYTGDSLGERPRRGLAVEPMTAPPDAFRSGTGVVRLEPGASTTASWGIQPLP